MVQANAESNLIGADMPRFCVPACIAFCTAALALILAMTLCLPSCAYAEEDSGSEYVSGADFTSKISYIDQNSVLPSGCEIVSLTSILNAMGSSLDAKTIYDGGYVTGDGSNDMVNSYAGDAYSSGAGMPPIIVEAGNKALADSGISNWGFSDATGSSIDDLLAYTSRGLPVLVWTTMGMDQPIYTGEMAGNYPWYSNEHCVVLYGSEGDSLLVMDPLEGLVERNKADFEQIYNACGNMAAVLESSGYESDEEDNAVGRLKTDEETEGASED